MITKLVKYSIGLFALVGFFFAIKVNFDRADPVAQAKHHAETTWRQNPTYFVIYRDGRYLEDFASKPGQVFFIDDKDSLAPAIQKACRFTSDKAKAKPMEHLDAKLLADLLEKIAKPDLPADEKGSQQFDIKPSI